jgi:dihydrofolate reductase
MISGHDRSPSRMTKVRATISISVDGYVAGPNQTNDNPLGEGGERLHEWALATEAFARRHGGGGGERNADSDVVEETATHIGATIMGRKMFGPSGEWDGDWRGWWGEDPPFHTPVYVLSHDAREPLEMEGGTTFHFVADGIESALEQARAAAGDKDVMIAGGASAINQYLAAGLVDELYLHVAPVVLGGGARLFSDVGDLRLEPVEVIASPAVTHVKYRVTRA